MRDDNPSSFLNDISATRSFNLFPFTLINRLKEAEQSPVHHLEGSAWNHTMLVVDEAAKRRKQSGNPQVFMWAALLHDIGKPDTTRNRKGKITAYNHDFVGADLAKKFLEHFSLSDEYVQAVVNLVRYHMHILYVLKDLPFGNIEEMKKQVPLKEIALLGFCDRLGRHGKDEKHEEDNIRLFLEKVERLGKKMAKNKDNKPKAKNKKTDRATSMSDVSTTNAENTTSNNSSNKTKTK